MLAQGLHIIARLYQARGQRAAQEIATEIAGPRNQVFLLNGKHFAFGDDDFDIDFVGPRPERPVFVAALAAQIPLYNERHMVKAGLTGWAQVNYPYGASVEDARSKLSYDLYYVKNFSILFDLVILLQTLREVLWPSGVR